MLMEAYIRRFHSFFADQAATGAIDAGGSFDRGARAHSVSICEWDFLASKWQQSGDIPVIAKLTPDLQLPIVRG